MSLPLPQLDNRNFAELMAEARQLIPRYAPEWTDFNIHDPGITFIELFAWLTEIQRYYLDRVREDNYLKFLKLLGIQLKDTNPAIADVSFSAINPRMLTKVRVLPGTKLITREKIVFETDRSLLLVPARLEKIVNSSPTGRKDNLDADRQKGISFSAFGDKAEVGNILYLGFKPLELFNWDLVPSSEENADTERLKQYLEQFLGISWVKDLDDQAISKMDRENTIAIEDGDRRLTLELDRSERRVKLTSTSDSIEGIYFSLFEADNSSIVCAQPFPANSLIPLTFNLFEDYPVKAGARSKKALDFVPSVVLNWEYYSAAGYWQKLEVECDETLMLYQSGRVWFNAPIDLKVRNIFPFAERLYWLRVKVIRAGYELPPKINSILLNTVSATQRETLREVITFSSNNKGVQSFPASYLTLKGDNILQVKKADGYWQDWQDYELDQTKNQESLEIEFKAEIPPAGIDNIRVISYLRESDRLHSSFKSNGLPNLTFSLKQFPILAKTFQLQVKEKIDNNYYWRDWIRVEDFDASRSQDPHYILDPQQGIIYFGDGVNGKIPPTPEEDRGRDNIRVIACQIVRGELGNVPANTINEIDNPIFGLLDREFVTVKNRQNASGGVDRESLELGKQRARKELKRIDRAVTNEDFEGLALATPRLRIARAKVILSRTQKPSNLVEIAIVPYSETIKPTPPSDGFLQAVARNLAKHRLITTQIRVIRPEFVEVKVKATVRIRPEFNREKTRQKIENFLTERFLNPLTGGIEGKGWPFGRTVYRSEVERAIASSTEAVDLVENSELLLGDGNQAIRVDPLGNIPISPQSLVYSLAHQIEIVSGR